MRTSRSRYYYGGAALRTWLASSRRCPMNNCRRDCGERGYRGDEKVGVMGVEVRGELFPAGKHGGRLLVVAPTARWWPPLAESPLQPAASIYTTLDRDLQPRSNAFGLQHSPARSSCSSAIPVKSWPWSRAPALTTTCSIQGISTASIFCHRSSATRASRCSIAPRKGQYPLGSVFKIVTLVGGVESGYYTPDSGPIAAAATSVRYREWFSPIGRLARAAPRSHRLGPRG